MSGRFDPRYVEERNERLRADAASGHGVEWLCATYGLSKSTIYRITDGVELLEQTLEEVALAEWERALQVAGFSPAETKLRSDVPKPSRDWIEALADVDPNEHRGELLQCVYFVQEERGYVKIGYSTTMTIRGRLAGLRNANPHKLWMRRIVAGGVSTEARLHAYFAHLHVRGEWFSIDDEIAAVGRLVVPSDHPD